MRAYRFKKQPLVVNNCPLVKRIFMEMHQQQIGTLDMAERSGINKNTLKDWRTRTTPRVRDLEAVGAVLGLRLIWVWGK